MTEEKYVPNKPGRRKFLTGAAITAATAATVGLGIEAHKRENAPVYETSPLSSGELENVFDHSFPNQKPNRLTSFLSRKPHKEAVTKYDKFKAETLHGITTHTKYRYKGTELNFYYPDDFSLPQQETLNAMYEFIEEETSFLFATRFAPVENTNFFIGNYGDDISFTAKRNLGGDSADTRVNRSIYERDKNDGFWTEFAQNMMLAGSAADNLALNQEFPANKIGVAAYHAQNGLSYEAYSQTSTEVYLIDKKVKIPHLSEDRYNKLKDIIMK